jgi:anti-anti-sigma factor
MPLTRTVPFHRFQRDAADDTLSCGRARLAIQHVTPTRVLAKVTGEIDATNRHALGRFVERHIRVSQQLIVDLSDVDFFGSQGFTALYYISVHCARRDVDWMVVGNRSVRRIMRICDPNGELPLVHDLATAHARLDHYARCRRSSGLTTRPRAGTSPRHRTIDQRLSRAARPPHTRTR